MMYGSHTKPSPIKSDLKDLPGWLNIADGINPKWVPVGGDQ